MAIERTTKILLAANAALSACLLWVNLSDMGPLGSSAEASPQYRSSRTVTPPLQKDDLTGVAGASTRQRKQMIDQLKVMSVTLDGIEKSLKSGSVSVRVENLDEVVLSLDYDRLAKALKSGGE